MKLTITLCTIACLNLCSAQFFEEDDLFHFGVGAAVSSGTYALVYAKTKNKKKAFWYSFGLSSLVGLSKEIYDGYIITGKFDTGEALATSLGGLTASYTFNIFTGKNKKKKKNKKLAAIRQ